MCFSLEDDGLLSNRGALIATAKEPVWCAIVELAADVPADPGRPGFKSFRKTIS